jgi:hypothetical protein
MVHGANAGAIVPTAVHRAYADLAASMVEPEPHRGRAADC